MAWASARPPAVTARLGRRQAGRSIPGPRRAVPADRRRSAAVGAVELVGGEGVEHRRQLMIARCPAAPPAAVAIKRDLSETLMPQNPVGDAAGRPEAATRCAPPIGRRSIHQRPPLISRRLRVMSSRPYQPICIARAVAAAAPDFRLRGTTRPFKRKKGDSERSRVPPIPRNDCDGCTAETVHAPGLADPRLGSASSGHSRARSLIRVSDATERRR
jgi:hypothetical protein